MNLQISGINLEITKSLKNFIETKLNKITKHVDNIISTNITLSIDKTKSKAEVDLHLAKKNIHIEHIENDMYATISYLMEKLDRSLLKHKEKLIVNHHK